jgi:hypothetical protein
MSGAIPPLPQYDFMAWCSVKAQVFLFNQWCTPPLRLQVSDCSTFLTVCDVPSTAAFCIGSTECFSGTVYRNVFSPSVTVAVVPMLTGRVR